MPDGATQVEPLSERVPMRLRSASARVAQALATTSYLQKWLILGAAIGVIAGLGAVLFFAALQLATHLLLVDLGGYRPPVPVSEATSAVASGHMTRPWAVLLVITLGGLVSGLLVFQLAPEAEGHGTDAAINAVHLNPRGIRVRTVVVKIVASAITIGSGGSGGREGPTAQISAGFGSLLARFLNLTPADGRTAVSVGIGSGIGAIFKAPLGGAVLAAEILYRDDLEVEALLPAIIASIISYAIFGAFVGFTPVFGDVAGYQFSHPLQLLWFALIGVLAGFVGLLYSRGFYGIGELFTRLPIPRWANPALGGLAVGLMALGLPQVLGTGYGWVQHAFDRQSLLHMSWAVVLLLPFARIVATGFSIGSGGSGGIFGPGMVIGAFVGAGAWRLLAPIAPSIPHQPAAFVLVGMMACFGSVSRAPLAVMLMVTEMTGSISELAPAMIAVGVATLIVRRFDETIYRSQLRSRSDSAAHRLQAGMPLLGTVQVREVMGRPRLVLRRDQTVASAREDLRTLGVPGGPVADEHGIFLGVVTRDVLDALDQGRAGWPLARVVDVTAPSVLETAALDVALEALQNGAGLWLSVIDSGQHVTGILTTSDVIRGYRRALESNMGRLSRLVGMAEPVELRVEEDSPALQRPIRSLHLPVGTIIVTVERGNGLHFADGDTVLEPGDLVSALVRPGSAEAFRGRLQAQKEPDDVSGPTGEPHRREPFRPEGSNGADDAPAPPAPVPPHPERLEGGRLDPEPPEQEAATGSGLAAGAPAAERPTGEGLAG